MRFESHFDPALEARSIVGIWLVRQAGGTVMEMSGGCPNSGELAERFKNLSPSARRAWLENNLAGLRAGEVTLEDLP